MRKNPRLFIGILLGVLLVLLGILGIVYYNAGYEKKWYKNTRINGMDVSGLTMEETLERLQNEYGDYSLTVTGRNNGRFCISGEDIDYQFQIGEELFTLFKKQHKKMPLFYGGTSCLAEFSCTFDLEKLKKLVKGSELVCGSPEYPIVSSESARVCYEKNEREFQIRKEIYGNRIRKKVLLEVVCKALKDGKRELDITGKDYEDVYQNPKILSTDEALTREQDEWNRSALKYLVWKMEDGEKEVLGPGTLLTLGTYRDGKIHYHKRKVDSWVEKVCLKYKTVGKQRRVKLPDGKKTVVSGGDFGWRLDYHTMCAETFSFLEKSMKEEDVQKYRKNPIPANRRKITVVKETPYLNKGQVPSYGDYPKDWDQKNYTLVSLEEQMVYVIRDGKEAFSCRCITGRPQKGRETTKGAYFIKEHREKYTLVGEDYETKVNHWVRITWMGIGFHPATWQSWSSWTKDKYKTVGSHGCVNLSPEDAKRIYELTNYKEAVFIY